MADRVIIFHRIVLTNPPSVDDMRSYKELGIPLRRNDPESLRRASGISLFDSLERARTQARRKPWMGNAFIAEMAFPVDLVRVEETAGKGHYTAWGNANAMLEFVRRVERVSTSKEWCEMVYALWDTRTTNLIASYDNEREALELVLSGIELNGPHDTDTLVLEVEDEQGELVSSIQGQALADFARQKLQPTRLA